MKAKLKSIEQLVREGIVSHEGLDSKGNALIVDSMLEFFGNGKYYNFKDLEDDDNIYFTHYYRHEKIGTYYYHVSWFDLDLLSEEDFEI